MLLHSDVFLLKYEKSKIYLGMFGGFIIAFCTRMRYNY